MHALCVLWAVIAVRVGHTQPGRTAYTLSLVRRVRVVDRYSFVKTYNHPIIPEQKGGQRL